MSMHNVSELGCTAAYVFAFRGPNLTIESYLEAIEDMARMGFTGLDLEILEDEHVAIYTDERIRALRAHARKHGVAFRAFTLWYAQKYLYSMDPVRRRRGLQLFEEGCRIVRALGIRQVHLGADVPGELATKRSKEYPGGPPMGMLLGKTSWKKVWDTTVDVYRRAFAIAARHGLRLGVEPRANSVIWSADSFLTLQAAVHPRLGCVWDPMHAAYHREDSALAIRKLGSSLMALQLCDADGEMMFHRPLGQGRVDLKAIKNALKAIAYRGPILLELYHSGDESKAKVDAYYQASKRAWERM